MTDESLERRLDAIASILKLAHADEIAKARATIRKDLGKASILDIATDWTAGGALVQAVAKRVKKSERSVQHYIGELLELGVLEKRGAARSIEYRTTGVI